MNNNNRFPIVSTILLVAILGVSIRSSQQVERNNALEVGGQENWEKLKTIMKSENYKESYKQQVEMIVQEFENPSVNTNNLQQNTPDNAEEDIDIDALMNSLNESEATNVGNQEEENTSSQEESL